MDKILQIVRKCTTTANEIKGMKGGKIALIIVGSVVTVIGVGTIVFAFDTSNPPS